MAARSFKLTSRKISSGSTTLRGMSCFRRFDLSLKKKAPVTVIGGVELAMNSLIFRAFLCSAIVWTPIASHCFL